MKVTILNSAKEEVFRKVKHIVNKCEMNHVPCVFNASEPYTKLVLLKDKSFEVELVDLEIDVKFKFNGWSSLGMVQRKDGIVQCYFDDPGLIKQYKNTDFHCDHCHKNVTRYSVVVLESESGERKVVGTSCVKEFTSGLDGNLIAEVNDYMGILKIRDSELRCLMKGEDDSDVFFESNGVRTYNVVDIVSAAKRIIDKYGFEPSYSYNATCKFLMDEYDRTNIEEEAVSAIDWIKSLSEEEVTKSSYLFNLKQIIDAEYCTGRHFGLLASLIPSYRKIEYKRLLDQKNSNNKQSEYIGNVGDKLSIKVTYLNTYTYETQFGNTNIHLFVDNDGNIFKWSTSSNLEYTIKDQSYSQWHILDRGATIQLSGKIKAHDEYRGQKQTVLTRCKYEVLESKDRDEKLSELEEYYSTEHKPVVDDCLKEIMNS